MKKRLLSLLTATVVGLSLLGGCAQESTPAETEATTTTAAVTTTEATTTTTTAAATTTAAPETEAETTAAPEAPAVENQLIVAYSEFNSKFSPFFAETAYDSDVAGMTQIGVLSTDRVGDIVFNAIEGETRSYNGTDYFYEGPADVTMVYDEDTDTTTYTYKLREGMKFSDGEPVDINDFLFSLYVYLDPAYNGNNTLNSENIRGLLPYLTGIPGDILDTYMPAYEQVMAGGEKYTGPFDTFTEEQYNEAYAATETAWKGALVHLADYIAENYGAYIADIGGTEEDLSNDGWKYALTYYVWGFSGDMPDPEALPTLDDFYALVTGIYNNSLPAYCEIELTGTEENPLTVARNLYLDPHKSEAADLSTTEYISGIEKLDEMTARITVDGFTATAIYRLASEIAPLHYYGDESQWDFENHQYGHPKGDLTIVHEKDSQPMGAGPYKFVKFENKIVYFEKNEYYWAGTPKIDYIQFKETTEDDKVSGIITGDLDVSDPSNSKLKMEEIAQANSNGEVVGDVLTYEAIDNLGYGYIGLNAARIKVGDDRSSEASRNLRKAIATVLAAYRDLTVDSYYGDSAEVLNYPISNTSWAAPQKTDADYQVAYSKDINGNDIYTSDMSSDERYAAALQASLGFFEAAGYTIVDGQITAAPEGAELAYTFTIGGDGSGDHPSFLLITEASEAFKTIGFDLIIDDVTSSTLFDRLDSGEFDLQASAWQSTIDPDIYQLYSGDNAIGEGGTDSNHYGIIDDELDELMLETRKSPDNEVRKVLFKQCFDIILDWAVEVPVYQRQNCFVFSSERVNIDTLPKDMTPYWQWNAELENLELNLD
jgi:peptide/nickel transport system substrate-binding protein